MKKFNLTNVVTKFVRGLQDAVELLAGNQMENLVPIVVINSPRKF